MQGVTQLVELVEGGGTPSQILTARKLLWDSSSPAQGHVRSGSRTKVSTDV